MKKIEQNEYIFDEKDIQTIKECLNYCFHRPTKHQCGALINLNEVQRLRSELGITTKIPNDHSPYECLKDLYLNFR